MLRNFTFTLAILFLSSPHDIRAQRENAWQTAVSKNNIEVKLYQSEDLKVRGFKAETTLYMPLDSLEAIFDRIGSYPTWQESVKEAKLVYTRSSKNYHIFTRERLAWPAKNREFMWAINKEWDERTGALVYDQVASNNTLPEYNDDSISQVFISWWLNPISADEIEVTYYLTIDHGGKMSSWMVNMLDPNLPYKTLDNLRSLGYAGEVISALD